MKASNGVALSRVGGGERGGGARGAQRGEETPRYTELRVFFVFKIRCLRFRELATSVLRVLRDEC